MRSKVTGFNPRLTDSSGVATMLLRYVDAFIKVLSTQLIEGRF